MKCGGSLVFLPASGVSEKQFANAMVKLRDQHNIKIGLIVEDAPVGEP
jgi:hypothetical protein